LRGFKVKFRDGDEEEIEERYACKNLIQDQFDKIEDLQQEVDNVEASSKISIKSEKIYFNARLSGKYLNRLIIIICCV
jgi:hypothetical protein